MSLKARISEDMKSAMKARETERLAAIRLLMAAIKQKEVDERVELDDAGITAVVQPGGSVRDDEVIAWFRQQVNDAGGGDYPHLMNVALREHIQHRSGGGLEETLRKVIREELRAAC